jgi:hypothetical protein
MGGDLKTAAVLQHGMEEGFVIEDLIASILVSQKFDEAIDCIHPRPQGLHNEIDVLSGELNPAIRNYHVHSITPVLTRNNRRVAFRSINVYALPRQMSLPETPHA